MAARGRVLVVDDDPQLTDLLEVGLGERDFALRVVRDAAEALACVAEEDPDVVLTDVQMPGQDGIQFCEVLSKARPDLPVVVMTAYGSMDGAVAAIRAGAHDYLTKPLDLEAVSLRLTRIVEERRLRSEIQRLRALVHGLAQPPGLLGESAAMRKVYGLVERLAGSDVTVLISGESGTGKEVLARLLHTSSERRAGPFVALNCAAVPESLLESELFGHVKGAFTDARGDRPGLFAAAHGGTLFLDEVGELPLALQPKLLRVLETRAVRPLGSSAEEPVDFRLLAATNRDLLAALDEGRFREDLYYRLNVVHVELPPLRSRGSDVLLLAEHFLKELRERTGKPVEGLSAPAAEKLMSYPWPGNVRELRNCMERAVALAQHSQVMLDDLPERVQAHRAEHVLVTSEDPSEMVPLELVEQRYILRVLEAVRDNKSAAAKILGLDRRTLYRKLERYHRA